METVDDDEWSRIVDGPMGAEGPPPIA
jgi:hypothetical protein